MQFWNRYYYSYLESFFYFLIPADKNIFRCDRSEAAQKRRVSLPLGKFDYCVASDILGHIRNIDNFLLEVTRGLQPTGHLVITQYNFLWEPVLRAASWFGLRQGPIEQNWLTMGDLKNLAYLTNLEVVKSGTKMLLPVYLPLISAFLNKFLVNFWPFSCLGFFYFLVLRRKEGQAIKFPPSVSIVVPAKNEKGMIEKIVKELPGLGKFTEIIFVEGGSTDGTFEEIKRVASVFSGRRRIKYIKQNGRGKGDAVRAGFDLAEGDILAIYDADMTVPPGELKKFYKAIVSNQADFINGSRLVYPMARESMRVLNFLGNKFFSWAFTWILGQPIKDTLCGTKVLWKKDYEEIKGNRAFFGHFDPFGDFDLLFGAAKLNLKIIDLPVHYRERTYGTTNISRWRHGWILFKMTMFAARKMKFI